MNAENRCRACGNVLPNGALNGLCPVCLLQEGLAGDGSAVDTGPFMSGTHAESGALATLDKSIGGLPRVLLRDSDVGSGPGPLVQPASPEMPAAGDRPRRLQLLGEIARGGMGAILKGRDPGLGRDLAVKVLLESHRDKPELIRRFIEEAQIGGQLQHPGIVPIYELGAFADRRPYFAMKLVKGRTLATLLSERGLAHRAHSPHPNPPPQRQEGDTGSTRTGATTRSSGLKEGDKNSSPLVGEDTGGGAGTAGDLSRFLAIFEQVAQTVAYAHARGVIHRDLKPSNIMVGSFGEVQVMDWGLAKVLPQGGAADDASAGKTRERGTVIATARSGGDSDSDQSRAGSVMGTPSYMAPEQARGEVDRLDERCDVFALGSVLCEILTGDPAFTGRSSGEIQRKASRGEMKDALDRLETSGSDTELVALAKECLAPELEDRPRHAGLVAARINGYQASVQERLRLAEIARAEEKARSEEATRRVRVERDRLRLTVALATSVIGLIILGAGGGAYLAQLRSAQRAKTERAVTKALDEATLLRGQARAAVVGDLSMWPKALAAAEKARSLLAMGEPGAALRARVDELVAAVERERDDAAHRAAELDKDRKFIERLQEIRVGGAEQSQWSTLNPIDDAYARAFREFGIDPDRLDSVEAGRLLSQRSEPLELAYFLDDWALARRQARNRKDVNSWRRLVATARATDRDPCRDAIRAQIGVNDLVSLRRLIDDERALALQPARSLLLLTQVLKDYEQQKEENVFEEKERELLARAWRLSPNDFWICSVRGKRYGDEPVRWLTAAVALRPGSAGAHHNLANGLLPYYMVPWTTLSLGDTKQDVNPRQLSPHVLDESIAEHRESVRLNSNEPLFHFSLGLALLCKDGKKTEAVAEIEHAQRLFNLNAFDAVGVTFSFVLFNLGKTDAAIAVMREPVREFPGYYEHMLAAMLEQTGRWREAIDVLRKVLRLDTYPKAFPEEVMRNHLFAILRRHGMIAEELVEYRETVRRHPADARAHNGLGYALLEFGELDSALSEAREALRTEPRNPSYLDSLGWAHLARGELKAALAALREAIGLQKEQPDSEIQSHLRLAERLAALEGRPDAIVRGQNVPSSAEGRLDVAELCRVTRRFAAASRFYREAFQTRPALADALTSQHRLHAAIAAAQAGTSSNLPKDDIRLDDAERARCRGQSREWLRAEKNACAGILSPTAPAAAGPIPIPDVTSDPPKPAIARKTLDIMTRHRDLACVRDDKELAKLPEAERKEWKALWLEVAELLKKAEKSRAREVTIVLVGEKRGETLVVRGEEFTAHHEIDPAE